jgi:HlyD family secretion protein
MSKTSTILSVATCIFAITGSLTMIERPIGAQQATFRETDEPNWQAVARGVVEPSSGRIAIGSPGVGRISDVLVTATDKVFAGELLLRLDDQEARARVTTAEARVAMDKRSRNDQTPGKAADRRRAEDAVADAATALVAARDSLDSATLEERIARRDDLDIAGRRSAWKTAQETLNQKRMELRKIEADAGTPLPTQSEGQLNIARSDLWAADVELERTRIRSPIDGTVLQVMAKVGELAAPSSPQPLIVLGDISALQVRAELDERDVGKVSVGQPVVISTDAFRGKEFSGKVASIAPMVQARRINSFGSRSLTNSDATEVLIDLSKPGPLMVGMQVNVYFQAVSAAN